MRMWITGCLCRLLTVSMLTTLAMACSEGSLKGSATGTAGSGGGGTGSGGTTGTGGGGTTGTGGGGTAGIGDAGAALQLPDCLAFLIDSCAPVGACVSSPLDAGITPDICFETGVHVTQTVVPDDASGSREIARVTRSDGSPCYSVEHYTDPRMAGEGVRYIWKNPAGEVVANALSNPYDNPTLTIACSPGGVSSCSNDFLTGHGNPCCGLTSYGVPVCTGGASNSCTTGTCGAGG